MSFGSLEHNLVALARQGCRITMFMGSDGRFQANVAELNQNGWVTASDEDLLLALNHAARLRLGGLPNRSIATEREMQIDIEDAISAAAEDEDLIG